MNNASFAIYHLTGFVVSISLVAALRAEDGNQPPTRKQYVFEDIVIPGAFAEEPLRDKYSLAAALDYVEKGARAWSQKRNCVSCHTNGSYGLIRPALSVVAGKPNREMREFFLEQLQEMRGENRAKLRDGLKPTQIAYIAAGLAEWDKHVSKKRSPETDAALELMFDVQSEDGSFSNIDCWPPLESSNYHGATVAAMAAAAAPGWEKANPELAEKYDKLKSYLRNSKPPHDYGRVLLLWAAASTQDLIDSDQVKLIIEMIWRQQRPDGGWSLRTFATPETWGSGNRAKKLRAEPEFDDPPSDGHMTGLAMVALLESGVPNGDARILKAVDWLKKNQRESGRWWTRSLNTDKFHFITYSGTCYPLLALTKCGEAK